jgi:hypothetical protein
MSRFRIALFTDRAYIDAHYCFRTTIENLVDDGWEVDLYMRWAPTHPVPVFLSGKVRIIFIPTTRITTVFFLLRCIFSLTRVYSVVIATPKWGLYWAAWIAQWRKFPLVCLADEVYPQAEQLTPYQQKWKRREAWAHRQCMFTIALSKERFELSRMENNLPKEHRFFVVPNAPRGKATRLKTNYLRQKLNIANEKSVLLHCGGSGWKLFRELMTKSNLLHVDQVVVAHGRYGGVLDGIEEAGKLRLSKEVVPAARMDELVSSADIGLALYSNADDGEIRNGPTAGKIGTYLKNCIPMIVGNISSLQWVDREKCGVWVSRVEDIPAAASKILKDYAMYSDNAGRVFERDFEFSKHFVKILQALEPFRR